MEDTELYHHLPQQQLTQEKPQDTQKHLDQEVQQEHSMLTTEAKATKAQEPKKPLWQEIFATVEKLNM